MPQSSDGRVVLRWIFFGSGWFLLLCDRFVVHTVLGLDTWAMHAYPGSVRHQALIVLEASVGLLISAVLCLITARGLNRSRRWSRWTGVCACAILLPGFPWLTMAGAIGLYALLAKLPRLQAPLARLPRLQAPPVVKQTTDYWMRKRKSWLQQALSYLGFFVAMACLGSLGRYAQHLGMPAWNTGGKGIIYLLVFGLFTTAVHEMGHATMAWALYHRVCVVSVGPFTFSNTGHGYQFHFDWKRMLSSGGHVASVPSGGAYLRLKYIVMIAAGPGASLLCGLLMMSIFLSLPGTPWQSYWWIPALISVMGIFDGVFNLIPVGYSDGSMLFHLILWTRPGRGLLNQIKAAQIQEDADLCHKRADFEQEVELREAALLCAQEGGEGNALAIALCYQALGHAKLAREDWPGAEEALRTCLGFEAECALHPPLAANAWLGLQRACVERHHVADVGRAYSGAVPILEGRKRNRDKIGLAVTEAMLAQVHSRAGGFEKALQETGEALRILPGGRDRLMLRAILYATQAGAELGLGFVERGLAAAHQAADILRSDKFPLADRNLGWDELGELGEELWRCGQDLPATDLLREAIEQLELGGAAATAAEYRIKLAAAFRQLGRLDEAGRWLPKDGAVTGSSRRCLLAERARLHLAAGHTQEAVADARQALALWQAALNDPVAEIAVAEAALAQALLESGDYSQAEALARQAADVLGPWRHCEAAGCLVTLALAQWRATGEWNPVSLEEARRIVQTDPLLHPAAKARSLEMQAARVERLGPGKEAQAAVAVPSYS